jgi:capsular exopolysaccharide synthesis family protein
MSRIFDALQQSEFEGAGFDFSTPSVAGTATPAGEVESDDTGPDFPSVAVSVSPSSRLVCLTNEESLGAEKFRFLAVRLRQLHQSRPIKTLLITSTIPEEGKSMVSGNLAVALARKKQQKILLLEGDLRRPVLAARLGLHHLAGLSEWLRGSPATIRNIYHLEELGFWFLPAGKPPENPLELMQSRRLADLLDQLTGWFDWIVIDSPPVLPLADTTVWTRLVDGMVLVAREGASEKRQLKRSLESLDRTKLLGVIFNGCSSSDHTSYYQRYGPVRPSFQP